MRESEVLAAYVAHLRERGWDVSTTNADYTDVVAKRGSERIVAEVKGVTSSPGLDVDTGYGQLLRRMSTQSRAVDDVHYALVVPSELERAALRVDRDVRDRLMIEVWIVAEDGSVLQAHR